MQIAHITPSFAASYRVEILRRAPTQDAPAVDIEIIRVRANNALHAELAARYLTGAAIAMNATVVVSKAAA